MSSTNRSHPPFLLPLCLSNDYIGTGTNPSALRSTKSLSPSDPASDGPSPAGAADR